MKKYLYLLVLLPTVVYAVGIKPMKCPSAKSIKSISINQTLFKDGNGNWYGGRSKQYYDTSDIWTFVIGNIRANNNKDAYRFALRAMRSLSFYDGPMRGRNDQEWVCLYRNNEDYLALTVTPPLKPLDDSLGKKTYAY
jgi:hypothetical protein